MTDAPDVSSGVRTGAGFAMRRLWITCTSYFRRGRENRENWSILLEPRGGLCLFSLGAGSRESSMVPKSWVWAQASLSHKPIHSHTLKIWKRPRRPSLPGILPRRCRVHCSRINEQRWSCYSHLSHRYGTLFLFYPQKLFEMFLNDFFPCYTISIMFFVEKQNKKTTMSQIQNYSENST